MSSNLTLQLRQRLRPDDPLQQRPPVLQPDRARHHQPLQRPRRLRARLVLQLGRHRDLQFCKKNSTLTQVVCERMRHLVKHLQKGEWNDTSGAKFIVSSKFLLEHADTSSWLTSVRPLDLIATVKSLGMSHKKLLQGRVKDPRVVVKIADSTEDLEVEWRLYETMSKVERPPTRGFVKYHGFFRCNDTLARARKKIRRLYVSSLRPYS